MNYFAKGPAIQLCDASTGHSVHSVAFCENSETAEVIVRAVNSHEALVAALEWYVKHDDSGENDGYYLAGLNAAKAALALAKEPT